MSPIAPPQPHNHSPRSATITHFRRAAVSIVIGAVITLLFIGPGHWWGQLQIRDGQALRSKSDLDHRESHHAGEVHVSSHAFAENWTLYYPGAYIVLGPDGPPAPTASAWPSWVQRPDPSPASKPRWDLYSASTIAAGWPFRAARYQDWGVRSWPANVAMSRSTEQYSRERHDGLLLGDFKSSVTNGL